MTTPAPIQVLALLNNDEGTAALREFLATDTGVTVSGNASTEPEALQKLKDGHVDVVLLDLAVREVDAIRLTREIRQSHPAVRVLICTAFRRSTDIFEALDAGADGYVLKGNHAGLDNAIRTVRLGAVWLDPGIATQVLNVMSNSILGKPASRTIPTGRMPIPLFPHEKALLDKVAASNCTDGVCMVDPDFVKKLKRFALAE